jgi:hypothetical protein
MISVTPRVVLWSSGWATTYYAAQVLRVTLLGSRALLSPIAITYSSAYFGSNLRVWRHDDATCRSWVIRLGRTKPSKTYYAGQVLRVTLSGSRAFKTFFLSAYREQFMYSIYEVGPLNHDP